MLTIDPHAGTAAGTLHWSVEPAIVLAIVAPAAFYLLGARRLARETGRRRAPRGSHGWAFTGAIAALVLALASPLDALSDDLFSAHMCEHLLIIMVAAPLFVVSNPLVPMLWAFPRRARVRLGRWWMRSRRLRRAWHALTQPAVAWVLSVATLFCWHVPAAYGWALDHEAVHALEHASFFITASLFWWVAIAPSGARRISRGLAALYVVSAGAAMGGLGAILTLAPRPWYAGHAAGTAAWHLTPLADQQLAGVIMWVPSSVVYLGVAVILLAQWIQMDDRAFGAGEAPAPVSAAHS